MKNTKILFALLLTVSLLWVICACSDSSNDPTDTSVSTTPTSATEAPAATEGHVPDETESTVFHEPETTPGADTYEDTVPVSEPVTEEPTVAETSAETVTSDGSEEMSEPETTVETEAEPTA